MHRLHALVRLHRQGVRPRAVCRLLTMSPKTELKFDSLYTAPAGGVAEVPGLDETCDRLSEGRRGYRPRSSGLS